MGALKDYLEASSIAGLSFLSSSKSLWSRSTWISAVIFSFFFAIYQIDSTFKSWDKNPVTIDMEILPISRVKLPGITVCPPKGSHTGLNYDLIRARNITLDNKDRQEMINYAVDHLIDDEVLMANVDMFTNADAPRHAFEGHTSFVTKPLKLGDRMKWYFATSTTSGSVNNTWFGEIFELAKFIPVGTWSCKIIVNYHLKMFHPGSYFVIEIQLDIDDDHEIFNMIYPDEYRDIFNLGEYFSGNKTLKRKIPIQHFFWKKHGRTVQITYERKWDQGYFLPWEKTRITGFHVKWYFEDENGETIDVYQPPAFMDAYTLAFQQFVNLVNTGVTIKGIAVEDIWERLNGLKRDWIIETKHDLEDESSPKYMKINDIEVLLSKFSDNIRVIQNRNLNNDISDEIIKIGYKMFTKLILCPAGRGDNNFLDNIRQKRLLFRLYIIVSPLIYLEGNQQLHWTSIYKIFNNLLNTSEPRMILQELFQIAKKDGEKIAMTVSGHLLQMIDNKMHLQYGIIKTAMFSNEYLGNSSNHHFFTVLKNEIDSCIKLGDCQPILGKMESIGENLEIK